MMKTIEGGVCAPKGFKAAGVAAQIKNLQSTKRDCALVVSEAPASVAGLFTTNRVKAAPVVWTESVCDLGRARAVFANSGNANACTGRRGMEDTQCIAKRTAQHLGVPVKEVAVLSTGVIGVPLPMERITQGIEGCVAALSEEGALDAAHAIMTTDTVPKELALEIALSSGPVRIGAMAKGSGMIAPNMATLLCVITTDVQMQPDDLQALLRQCAMQSFNCICVDNDMSTNDTLLCLANGQAGMAPLAPGTGDYALFAEALQHVCVHMAQSLVRDGEGASKFVEIQVQGALNDKEAKMIARAIASSQLCKTAFAGEDPNWGRIACAAGYAGAFFEQKDLCICLDEVEVVRDGLPTEYEEAAAAAVMKKAEYMIRVSVGDGPGKACFWTSDLSHEYVTINADYRT